MVANLPYNVAVPIVLHLLETFSSIRRVLVMVQAEVADRVAAAPGGKVYGVPSVKAAWYGQWSLAGSVGKHVFWPAPNVDSALVRFSRYAEPRFAGADRALTFSLIDAAFGQRRKTLHAALKRIVPAEAFTRAGIDATRRGETLTIDEFATLSRAVQEVQAS